MLRYLKYFLLIIFFLFLGSLIIEKEKTIKVLDKFLPKTLVGVVKFLTEININSKRISNDYNIKFLPETQFENIDFKKNKLSFPLTNDTGYLETYKRKPFVFDVYKDFLIVAPKKGTFFYQNLKEVISNKKNFKEIISNLNTNNLLDIFIDDQNLYVSYVKKIDDCKFLYLAKSKINLKKFNFKDIFKSSECMSRIQSGRIQKTKYNNEYFILLSTGANILKGWSGSKDPKPQDDNSIYGKIISINLKNYNYSIFSKGHRNILGLSSIDDVILSTENGPKGGDEINRIFKDKNYGWPIASDGNKYQEAANSERDYSDHSDLNFEPPIFSFIPSIGISEIIKIENNFAKNWQNNYLIGSLNGNHIYRIRFNKLFNKINYFEKIFIGERIRDLKYINKYSIILMALEDSGSIGIIKNNAK